MRKQFIIAVTAVAAMAVTAGCGSSGSASTGEGSTGTITIPFLGELSGAYSPVGAAALAGAQTAVYEINKAGGVGGRQVALKTYDGQSDPTAEATAVRSLLGTSPSVMITATVSSAFLPSLSSVAASKVVDMATTPPLPDNKGLAFFTSYPDEPVSVAGQIAVLKSVLGGSLTGKKIAIAELAGSAIGDAKQEIYQKAIEDAGGTLDKVFKDPIDVSSWTTQGASLKASGDDALLMDQSPSAATVIAKGASVAGFSGPIVSSNAANGDDFLKALNLPNLYGVRDSKSVTDGDALFKATAAAGASTANAQLTNFYAYGYGATYAALETLNACGVPCSSTDFATKLAGLGKIKTPESAFYGDLDWSGGGVSGVNFAQGWTWDASTEASKSVTGVLDLS